MKRRRVSSSKRGIGTIILAIGVALASLILTALILTVIAYTGSDPSSLTEIFSIISVLVAFCTMGIFVSRRIGEGGVLWGALCSGILSAVMIALELIINRGRVSMPFIINLLCALGACLIGARVGRKRRGRRHG